MPFLECRREKGSIHPKAILYTFGVFWNLRCWHCCETAESWNIILGTDMEMSRPHIKAVYAPSAKPFIHPNLRQIRNYGPVAEDYNSFPSPPKQYIPLLWVWLKTLTWRWKTQYLSSWFIHILIQAALKPQASFWSQKITQLPSWAKDQMGTRQLGRRPYPPEPSSLLATILP